MTKRERQYHLNHKRGYSFRRIKYKPSPFYSDGKTLLDNFGLMIPLDVYKTQKTHYIIGYRGSSPDFPILRKIKNPLPPEAVKVINFSDVQLRQWS